MADALWYFQENAVQALFRYFDAIQTPLEPHNPLVLMPTGTGKSHVIAEFCKRALHYYPSTRVLMLTHVKELIEQNAEKLERAWPGVPLGIYSASLKLKQTNTPIIYGGVQSVINNIDALGAFDLLKIDEAHLLSPEEESRYRIIIKALLAKNRYMRTTGFTATGYRQGQGLLTEGETALFTDVAFDITGMEWFNRLIAEGYIAPLLGTPSTTTKLDLSSVSLDARTGDYNLTQLQKAVNKTEITRAALEEFVWYGQNRRSWIMFCSGVEHADDVAKMLWAKGIPAASIHSKLERGQRERRIEAFKAGQLRCLTTNNLLTTGFDHRPIDLIGVLRPTISVSLWVQLLGRGTRISPETYKTNCLVLDFTNNTVNLGPINDPVIPRPKGAGGGVAPVKICDEKDGDPLMGIPYGCGFFNHISARYCCNCSKEFNFEVKIREQHAGLELIKTTLPVVKEYRVNYVMYSKHMGRSSGNYSLRATYVCEGNFAVTEWVPIESEKARGLASGWWKKRSPTVLPSTVDEALEIHKHIPLTVPYKLTAHVNKDPPELMKVYFQ